MQITKIFMKNSLIRLLIYTIILAGTTCSYAKVILDSNLRESTESGKWKHVHFRGNSSLSCTHDSSGIILKTTTTGSILDSFSTTFPNPKNACDIRVKFNYRSTDALPLLVIVSNAPGAGAPAIKQLYKVIADGKWHCAELEYSTKAFGKRDKITLEFVLEGGVKAGEFLQLSQVTVETMPLPSLEYIIYPRSGHIISGFGPQTAEVYWTIRHKSHILKAVLKNKNKIVKTIKFLGQAGRTVKNSFNFSKLPNGDYSICLYNGKEEVDKLKISKIPSVNNRFFIAGNTSYYREKPFFVIGLFHAGDRELRLINAENRSWGIPEYTRNQMFKEMKERHFNVAAYGWGCASVEFHHEAAKFGLLVMNETRGNIDTVKSMKNIENIMGWYSWDEPKGSEHKACSDLYAEYKKIDPYRPVCIAFDSGGAGADKQRLTDVAMLDPYPIGSPASDVGAILSFMDTVRQNIILKDRDCCEFAVSQFFSMDGSRFSSEPLISQVRAEVYTALAGGARGIFYYGLYTHEMLSRGMSLNPKRKHWFLPESKLWNQIGELNQEIVKLQDVYLTGQVTNNFKLQGATSRAWEYDGEVYLLAVNHSGSATINGKLVYPYGWKPVARLFSKGEIPKQNIKIEPYEVIILKFNRK